MDSEIHHLRKELSEQPILQKQIETEFEKKKVSLKAAEDEYKAFQLKQKEKEMGLASSEDKINKLSGQLYQLKSNKEYSAMEMEIKGLKADKSLLEEEILILLDTVETAKAKITKEKEILAGEEKKLKAEVDVIKKKSSELEQQIAQGEEKRKVHLPGVEARLLAQYEKLLKNRDGLAVAPLLKGSCGGCHIGLPPQVVNEIHMRDKIITCESCARILYFVE